MMLNQYVS